jgi:hypothetical protein
MFPLVDVNKVAYHAQRLPHTVVDVLDELSSVM